MIFFIYNETIQRVHTRTVRREKEKKQRKAVQGSHIQKRELVESAQPIHKKLVVIISLIIVNSISCLKHRGYFIQINNIRQGDVN